jgi:hypothetical protein
LGRRPSEVHNAPNKLGEFLVYGGPVGDADVAKNESYLKQKDSPSGAPTAVGAPPD